MMTVSLDNPGMAAIAAVTYPPWAQMHTNPGVPAQEVAVSAVDTGQQVIPGDMNVTLVTITVRGDAAGTTLITVSVTGMDADGGTSIQPTAVNGGSAEIVPVPPPVAGFSATPLTGPRPLTVQFTDESAGPVTSWAWDFENDGTVDSTTRNPSRVYEDAGIYTVNLTVSGPGGSDAKVMAGYHRDLSAAGRRLFRKHDVRHRPARGRLHRPLHEWA